jgi:hypothetical protein
MLTVEQLQQQSVRAKELGHAMTIISVEELDMLIGAKIAYQDAHELRTLLGAEQRSNESLLAVARAIDKAYASTSKEQWSQLMDQARAQLAALKATSPQLKAEIEK